MARLEEEIDSLAERTGFSGVVHVETRGRVELAQAHGMADRAHGIANTVWRNLHDLGQSLEAPPRQTSPTVPDGSTLVSPFEQRSDQEREDRSRRNQHHHGYASISHTAN